MAEQSKTLVYPVIPIRDLVIFPGIVSPLFISRPKSIRAVEEAADRDRTLFIVSEKRPYSDTLQPEGLYKVGTVCKMLQNVRLPDGTLKVVVEGGRRAEVKKMASNDSFMLASVVILDSERPAVSTELRALMRAVLRGFEENVRLDPKLPEEIARSVRDINDPEVLCDIIASHGNFDITDKQKILETVDAEDRLNLLMKMLVNENELLGFERDLEEKVRSEIDRDQHNYYLREQLKVINDELGEESPTSEADELREAAAKCGMPEDILQKVNKEIGRFCKLPPLSPEAAVARNYIETLTELPWNVSTEDNLDIANARKVLDEDHYGLEDVKERILEFLAVKKRAGDDMRAQVICFVGFRCRAFFAELVVYNLELLAQVIIVLVAVDFRAHLLFKVAFEAKQLVLVHKHLHKKVKPVFDVDSFQDFLFVRYVEVAVRGYDVAEHFWIVYIAHGTRYLFRQLRVEPHVFLKLTQHRAHQRAKLRRESRTLGIQDDYRREHKGVVRSHFLDFCSTPAFDYHFQSPVRQPHVLKHLADRTDFIKPLRLQRVAVRAFFRDDEKRTVAFRSLFNGPYRFRPADEQRRDDAREYNQVADRDNRIDQRLTLFRHRRFHPFPPQAANFLRQRL